MIDIDQLALDTTEKVYAVDPAKLRGGDAQAKAIIQCLIYAAIQVAINNERQRADALAAHVASPVIAESIDALGHASHWQEQEELQRWAASAPTTSLDRLKAKWQAEVLEEAGRFVRCEEDAALLRINARELRRQAKEASDGD